jgi:dihydrofolate reductase
MTINAIVAIDKNNAIGKGGAIPWHYSSDLKFFKQQTIGHAVVMGYRTWESIGGPLKNRLNIVVSRSHEIEPREGVILLRDPASIMSLAPYLSCDLYIIGGAQIYEAFGPMIDRWLVTHVPIETEGADTFMPAGFLEGYQRVDTIQLQDGPEVGLYERPRRSGVQSSNRRRHDCAV